MPHQYEQIFKSLADENRRRILLVLSDGPRSAGDLARQIGLAPNALSFHLKDLRSAKLVRIQRKGRYLYYQLVPGALEQWLAHVQQLFSASTGYDEYAVKRSQDDSNTLSMADEVGHKFEDSAEISHNFESQASEDNLPTELL